MPPHIAPPVPNRNALEKMKRVDLQRLCKDYGVRANLKSEELIELLLETRKPNIRSVQPVRSVSTRRASRSAGRVSSMIIHDEDGTSSNQESIVTSNENQTGPPTSQASTSHPPRTRSSKYAPQTRLGVGRPVAAGGQGPRAVTKSLSLSKRRGKGSRSVNPKETTIVEEPEPELEPEEPVAEGSGSIHAVSSHNTPSQPEAPSPAMSRPASSQPSPSLDDRIAQVIAPLQRQLQTLKEDLEQMNALKAELDRLKTEVATIGPLKESVALLTSEVKALRSQTSPAQLLLPGSSMVVDKPSRQYTPGAAPILLGKRPRDSTGSEDSDVMENDEDSTVHQGLIPPDRKRQRLDDAHADFPKTPPNHPQSLPPHIQPDDVIRGGPLGTPPPLDRLPELYGTPSSPPERKRDHDGNGHPFNFTFTVPVPPTPNPAFTMPFAYPEPPQSPTPAQHPRSRLLGPPRADIFQAIRRASMERSRQSQSNAESSQGLGTFLNEAALGADSDQAGNSTLLSDLDVLDPEGGSPSKRTMYGTEMESDNRFGDFGFEGVNPSYWAPKF